MRTWQVIRAGACAGAVGALVMIVGQAIARLGAGVPMFPDLFENAFTRGIPPVLFSAVLDALQHAAKPLLFIGILVLQIVVGAVIGIIFALLWRHDLPGPRRRWHGWNHAFLCAFVAWLVTGLALLPIAGEGIFGAATAVGPVALGFALALSFFLFGLVLAGTYRVAIARVPVEFAEEPTPNPERRRLLGGFAVGAVAILAAGATYRILDGAEPGSLPGIASADPADRATPTPRSALPAGWQIPGLPPEVTPTKDFYVVSKDFFAAPAIDTTRWTLQIGGLVQKPYTLSYAQLLKLPHQDRYQTLECISNGVGGNLISNASWRGVSLHALLAQAQPDPKTTKVVFSAADGYTDSIPFERAMNQENLLAYLMNDQPLAAGHGAPARLLIPGIFGMKNVKWLTKIHLVSDDYQGYWEQRGWSDQAVVKTMSEIATVDPQEPITAGPVELAGIAFAGDRGIKKVEVSLDGGKSWHAATLKDPLGPYTWRLWRFEWDAKPGLYQVFVRAIDGTGQVQTSEQTETLPNGATGWDSKRIRVG